MILTIVNFSCFSNCFYLFRLNIIVSLPYRYSICFQLHRTKMIIAAGIRKNKGKRQRLSALGKNKVEKNTLIWMPGHIEIASDPFIRLHFFTKLHLRLEWN